MLHIESFVFEDVLILLTTQTLKFLKQTLDMYKMLYYFNEPYFGS